MRQATFHPRLGSFRKRITPAIVAGVLAATIIGLCGAYGDAAAVLRVTATTPVRLDLDVPQDLAEIWAFFNGPLASLPSGCVRVSGTMSGLHDGSAILMDNVIRFLNGSEPFFPGEMVVVNYRSDIENLVGENLTGGFTFAFTIASGPAVAAWSEPRIYPSASIPYFIYGGDMDEDNTPDVVAPNEGTDNVSVFLNSHGLGTFPTHLEYGVGDKPSSIFGEDFDNDGDQDLATADINSGTVSVLLNNGDGTFAPRQIYAAGAQCRQIHGGDFDGDNDVDLCATAFQADRLHIFYNDGDGTFTPAAPITTISDGPFAIRSADLNADGHQDIGVACQNADILDIFLNDGAGWFSRTGSYTIGNGPWCLNGNDMDGDGDFDLASVASFGNQLVVLFNDGAGAFPIRHTAVTQSFPLGVFTADLDGDGDIDATSSNFSGGSVGVYLNPGNGQVALQTNLDVLLAGSYTWAHDLDGDGDLDLSVVDEEADLLFVFYNGAVPADAGIETQASGTERLRVAIHPNPIDAEGGAVLRLTGIGDETFVDLIGIDGRRLRRIWSGTPLAGGYSIAWDGCDALGARLAAGHYYVAARSSSGRMTSEGVVIARP